MGIYDSLKPFASDYPNRTENFIQQIKLNPDTGLYETTFSPHAGYNDATGTNFTGNTETTYNGCPEGQIMGPDGVCRVDPNYQGQPVTPETPDTPTDPIVPEVPDTPTGGGGFMGGNEGGDSAFDRQQALYRSITEGGPTSSTGQIDPNRKDKYQTLPGGMKNWSNSQLYQWALDNNYFTAENRMSMKVPPPGSDRYAEYNKDVESYFNNTMMGQLVGKVGEFFSKKGFDDWLDVAQKREIIKREGEGWKILKGPGDNTDSMYAGGYLVPLDEQKQIDANYAQGYFNPVETPTGGGTELITSNVYDDLANQGGMWWQDTMMTWLNNGYNYGTDDEEGTGKPAFPGEMQPLVADDLVPKPDYFSWYPSAADIEPDYFSFGGRRDGSGDAAWKVYRDHILGEAKIFDKDNTREYNMGGMSQTDFFNKAHPDYDFITQQFKELGLNQPNADKRYWLDRAGIPKEEHDNYRLTSKGPHVEEPGIVTMQGEVYSPSINLSAPVASSSMNYKQLTSVYGNNINEVTRLVGTIGSKVQKTDIVASSNDGSQGSKNQDGSTKDWGYDADGRFVNTKTGQTAAMGSMNDAVKAINTGNVSSKVLDRFAWEHKDNTTGYNSKEEYLAAQDTKVTYRDNDGNQSTVDSGSYDSSNDKSTGKIICDYFYRKGLLSKKLWEADEAYGVKLSISEPDVMRGYHAWAKHYVREMEKESLLGKVYFAWAKLWVPHWAKHLAGEKTIRGKILHSIGKPICNIIGKFKRRLTWQQA